MRGFCTISRESFALVKGAVLLLGDGESGTLDGGTFASPPSPVKEGGGAQDTRRKHLQAMVEQLRPEDTVKLVRHRVSPHVENKSL